MCPPLPGLRCKKKGLPLLATASNTTTTIKTGDKTTKATNASTHSIDGLMNRAYAVREGGVAAAGNIWIPFVTNES